MDRLCVGYGFRFVNGRSLAFGEPHLGDSLMHIICPHCTTFYGVDSSVLGKEGRTVRCSRCKEVWLARSDDMTWSEHALMPMTTLGGTGADSSLASLRNISAPGESQGEDMPTIESPPIAGDWPASALAKPSSQDDDNEWPLMAMDGEVEDAEAVRAPRPPWLRRLKPRFAI